MRARLVGISAGVIGAAAVLAWNASSFWNGDYPNEAGPVIDDLIHGRIHEFVQGRPLMGPLSLLLRAPFAAFSLLTGGGGPVDLYDNAYRFGVFPCALAGGLLGIALYVIAERDGRRAFVRYGALVLCTVNPLTLKAITYGHPEEILAAALMVGALLAAVRRQAGLAAALLVAALATKQWALLAVPTLLLAVPWRSIRRPLLILAGLAVLLTLPVILANPETFLKVNRGILDVRSGNTGPASVWWLFTPQAVPGSDLAHRTPDWLGIASRPLIIGLSIAIPLLLRQRIRDDPGAAVLSTLALVFLMRSALDPVNNSYYHLPFFMALVAADVMRGSLVPSLIATGCFAVLIDLAAHPLAQGITYAIWAPAFAAYLLARIYGLEAVSSRLGNRGARGRAAAPQVR